MVDRQLVSALMRQLDPRQRMEGLSRVLQLIQRACFNSLKVYYNFKKKALRMTRIPTSDPREAFHIDFHPNICIQEGGEIPSIDVLNPLQYVRT